MGIPTCFLLEAGVPVGTPILQVISRTPYSGPRPKGDTPCEAPGFRRLSAQRDTPYDAQRLQVIRAEEMANPTGFSVPPSEVVSISDTSAINHSSSSDQSTLLSMEQKKLKSPSGHAIAVTTEQSGYSGVHKAAQSSATSTSRPVTERNVQLHAAQHKAVSRTTSQAGSVVSSAERARRYEVAKAAFETAQVRE